MSQQLSRHLYFFVEVAVFLCTALKTLGMRDYGLQAKDDGKRMGEISLTVEGILSSLCNAASGAFREMKLCDKINNHIL